MKINVITKFGEELKSFYTDGSYEIPLVNDTIVVNNERYRVVNRTYDVDNYVVTIEVWKEVMNEDAC